ncbi:MAG: gamma-glutamylcyclotransferase family protein [Candidatus Binatia bacterium]
MYYYAYGSNMNWEQMQRRCPSSRFVCVARLPGYRFVIARHSRLRKCGTANIFVEDECEVWGIVYDVNDTDLCVLDGFEDGYRREKVRVYAMDDGCNPIEALVYIAPTEGETPLPNPEYKRLMLEGAKYWKLPAAYAEMLKSIDVA